LIVTWTIKDYHREVIDRNALRIRDALKVHFDWSFDVDLSRSLWATDDLLHIEDCRRIEHRSTLCKRYD
jgi:hypothetical protein